MPSLTGLHLAHRGKQLGTEIPFRIGARSARSASFAIDHPSVLVQRFRINVVVNAFRAYDQSGFDDGEHWRHNTSMPYGS
jgi:hypothetical protein